MGSSKSWLWNVNKTEDEARQILRDPAHPAFLLYAAKRLANANRPKEIFRDYLSKEVFLRFWSAVKRQMRKDSRNRERIVFWQGVYEYLVKDLKSKGTPFVRPKAEVRVDLEQKRIGEGLKALRLLKKMTQTELAEKAGLTQQHIAKIEKGITCPRPQTMKKIKSCLGEYSSPQGPSSPQEFIREASFSKSGTTWIF